MHMYVCITNINASYCLLLVVLLTNLLPEMLAPMLSAMTISKTERPMLVKIL